MFKHYLKMAIRQILKNKIQYLLSIIYNPQNQKSRFQKRKIKKTANDLLIAFIV